MSVLPKLIYRAEGSDEAYVLPETRPTLTLLPTKPKREREESPDDIVALDVTVSAKPLQSPTANGLSRKREAPVNGDSAAGTESLVKKRKLGKGNEIFEID